MIEEAAAVAGESVSDFMRNAAEERASKVLFDLHWTVVPSSYFDDLVHSLDEPPGEWPQLREAFRNHDEIVELR